MRMLVGSWLVLACCCVAHAAPSAAPIDLVRGETETLRITMELTVGGNNIVRPEDTKQAASAEQQLPMSVAAKLVYDERALPVGLQSGAAGVMAARHYETAEATLKVDQATRTPRLPDDRRRILVQNGSPRPVLHCPDGTLSREQLDLLDVVANTALLDQLLPTKPVSAGESWSHDPGIIAGFLALDSVAACEVQSVLEDFNGGFAKVRIGGTVHGMAEGAATEIELRGVYLFDRSSMLITRLNLAVSEKRSVGAATPGVDAIAKLQVQIEPTSTPASLSDEALAAVLNKQNNSVGLTYEAPPLGFRFRHDRQWFITSEQRESLTLRRIDLGNLAAQCTVTVLPPKSAGRQTTLEQFQKDVAFSLGKSFGEFVSSRQWRNAAGLHCYALVSRGFVDEVPVEWRHYLIAPESGHRVSAAVTIEKTMVDRVGDADRQLIESLELFPRMPVAQTADQAGSTRR